MIHENIAKYHLMQNERIITHTYNNPYMNTMHTYNLRDVQNLQILSCLFSFCAEGDHLQFTLAFLYFESTTFVPFAAVF